jgi:hypothetical protein
MFCLKFALGWWFLIDGTVNDNIQKKHQAIGTMSTVGMFMYVAVITVHNVRSQILAS